MKRVLLSNGIILTTLTLLLLIGSYLELLPLRALETFTYDQLLALRRTQPNDAVVLVEIDDVSIQQIGPWPWPRDYVARGIERLSRNGAAAIGLTLLYPERALNPALEEIDGLRAEMGLPTAKSQARLAARITRRLVAARQRLDQDQHLIQAVRAGINVALPYQIIESRTDAGPPPPLPSLLAINSQRAGDAIIERPAPLVALQRAIAPLKGASTTPIGVQETYSELAGKAGALGYINIPTDSDGIVRRLPLLKRYRERYLAALPLQLAIKARSADITQLAIEHIDPQSSHLDLSGKIIPTDGQHAIFINFSRGAGPVHRISYAALLDDQADLSVIKNRIAIIGLTAKDYTRSYAIPQGRIATTPEITAAALDTILSGNQLQRTSWALLLEGVALFYFLFFLLIVIPRVRLRIGGLILLVFLTTWWGVAAAFFLKPGYWVWFFPPVLLCLAGYGLTAARQMTSRIRSENLDLNRSLGLSFQAQGMLDMAFDKFLQCPADDKRVRRLLYNLGLDFERKRMADKALAVYERILKAGSFKDVKQRVKQLRGGRQTTMVSSRREGPNGTLRLSHTNTLPTCGRYEIIQELGQGAMGTVYLGRDPKINRRVAIKTLPYGSVPPGDLTEVKRRFIREAEAAGKLSHPNIVTVFDIGEEHDMAYMAMELLEGTELTPYSRPGRLLPVGEVLDIMAAVADALAYAHQQGVVHRDIKPANIMRLKKGSIRVTDFGIARVLDKTKTNTGIVMGTPSYMSPEQIAGKRVDGRSDLFSLGIVFYEMLTGQKPFIGESMAALMYAIAKSPFKPLVEVMPDLPPECIAIVGKMLSKGVTRRYKTAKQALDAIRHCREGIG
jgi:serine/threonine-protein kinase